MQISRIKRTRRVNLRTKRTDYRFGKLFFPCVALISFLRFCDVLTLINQNISDLATTFCGTGIKYNNFLVNSIDSRHLIPKKALPLNFLPIKLTNTIKVKSHEKSSQLSIIKPINYLWKPSITASKARILPTTSNSIFSHKRDTKPLISSKYF